MPKEDPGVLREPRVLGGDVVVGQNGEVYVTVDDKGDGYLYELSGPELSPTMRVPIGPGQVEAELDEKGRIWTLGDEVSRRVSEPSITIVDPDSEQTKTILLPGIPGGMAFGPQNSMFVTLYGMRRVIEVQPSGRISRAIDGLPPGPWGIAISETGLGVVVSEDNPIAGDRLTIIDFDDLQIIQTIELNKPCPVPREAILVGDQVVITCIGLPGLLLVDLNSGDVIATALLGQSDDAPGGSNDQPQGLTIVKPPPQA